MKKVVVRFAMLVGIVGFAAIMGGCDGQRQKATAVGAVAGAGLGAATGALVSGGKGAAIGGILGGIFGGTLGNATASKK